MAALLSSSISILDEKPITHDRFFSGPLLRGKDFAVLNRSFVIGLTTASPLISNFILHGSPLKTSLRAGGFGRQVMAGQPVRAVKKTSESL